MKGGDFLKKDLNYIEGILANPKQVKRIKNQLKSDKKGLLVKNNSLIEKLEKNYNQLVEKKKKYEEDFKPLIDDLKDENNPIHLDIFATNKKEIEELISIGKDYYEAIVLLEKYYNNLPFMKK